MGRELEQRDVVRDRQVLAAVPAGAVEHQHRMGAGGNGAGDLGEVQVHRPGVGEGQDQGGAGGAGQTAPKM